MNNNQLVSRLGKKWLVYSLLFFFAFGVGCASLAAFSSTALAAPMSGLQPGCGHTVQVFGGIECDQPSLICPFGFVSVSLTGVELASSRFPDFSKEAQFLSLGVVPVGPSGAMGRASHGRSASSLVHPAQKVSIHLFNSVLTL